MPPRYTPQKINDTIKSINDLLENHKKQEKNYRDMLRSLELIKLAMHEDIEKYIRVQEEKMFKIVLAEKRKEDPNYSPATCKMLARARIMKNSKFYHQYETIPRWGDYKFQIQKIWEEYRAKFIKSGEIEGNKKIQEASKN